MKTLANFEFLAEIFLHGLQVECNEFGEVSCNAYTIVTGFERLGPCSIDENSSVLVFILKCMPGILLLMLILFIIGRCNSKIRGLYLAFKKRLFWNPFIRYSLESTLELQLSAGTVIVLSSSSYFQDNSELQ